MFLQKIDVKQTICVFMCFGTVFLQEIDITQTLRVIHVFLYYANTNKNITVIHDYKKLILYLYYVVTTKKLYIL